MSLTKRSLAQRTRKARRASALIITILLIAVISSIAFAVSALTISELRKSGGIQDSISAYYAAESGLEQGLLQYRLERDSEISKELTGKLVSGQTVGAGDSPTATLGSAQVFSLGSTNLGLVRDGQQPGNAWYGLKMYYKGSQIGAIDGVNNPIIDASLSQRINRDSAIELSVPTNAATAEMTWQPINPNLIPISAGGGQPAKPYSYFIEAVKTNLTSGKLARDINTSLDRSSNSLWKINLTIPGSNPATVDRLRLKPWQMDGMIYSLVFRDGSGNAIPFDNQLTILESTGSVGRAKRKLQLGVHRSGGTILESQDFLFLSGDNPLVIP